jgi:hypothetical protein
MCACLGLFYFKYEIKTTIISKQGEVLSQFTIYIAEGVYIDYIVARR